VFIIYFKQVFPNGMLTQAGKYIGSVIKKNPEKAIGFYNYTQLFHSKLKAWIFKFF